MLLLLLLAWSDGVFRVAGFIWEESWVFALSHSRRWGVGYNRKALPCCHRHDGLWLRGLCPGPERRRFLSVSLTGVSWDAPKRGVKGEVYRLDPFPSAEWVYLCLSWACVQMFIWVSSGGNSFSFILYYIILYYTNLVCIFFLYLNIVKKYTSVQLVCVFIFKLSLSEYLHVSELAEIELLLNIIQYTHFVWIFLLKF